MSPPNPQTSPPTSKQPYNPTLHTASELLANPQLAATITSFVNLTYKYARPETLARWDKDTDERLSTPESIHTLLGPTGLFAVIYDPNPTSSPPQLLACASTSPWRTDLLGQTPSLPESGWELKTVGVHPLHQKLGLATLCIDFLTQYLLKLEGGKVTLWIHTVEDLNGVYWRKRGFVEEVRGWDVPRGVWGSKEGFRITVLRRVVEAQGEDELVRGVEGEKNKVKDEDGEERLEGEKEKEEEEGLERVDSGLCAS